MNRRKFLQAGAASFVLPSIAGAASGELVIKGGRVIDPSQRIDKVADVLIRGGKIAGIRESVDAKGAEIVDAKGAQIIDARGKIVTPGLIDIHLHIVDKESPPGRSLMDGVTSVIDGGSRGADNINESLSIAAAAPNRCRVLINIAHLGINPGGMGELLSIDAADVQACRKAVEKHRDQIVGIKARLSENVAGNHDVEALRRARLVADPMKIPIMIHMGQTVAPLKDLLQLLRAGDIVTHLYAPPPHGIMDDSGRILPEVREARRRGVLFDVGNGRLAHITWEIAERAMAQDFLPDTISTDVNGTSRTEQVFDLPNVMSKFLLLGMSLDQVIARTTMNSAKAIPEYKAFGTLRTGAVADVSVLDLRQGQFEFVDNIGGKRIGKQKLFPDAVVFGGRRAG
jgi:dihydroorotase